MTQVALTVNGERREADVEPRQLLVYFLRDQLGLKGTNVGCDTSSCGACTVLVNGLPVNSCLIPLAHAGRARVTTIEGLGGRHPLQRAFVELGGAQCGICTPGMIMAAVSLGSRPSLARMRTGLAGNLCRCTGYSAIYRSIRRASGASRHASTASGGTRRRQSKRNQ